MGWVSGIVVYFLTWWTILFTVLPRNVRQPDQIQPGHGTGAPENPGLKQKFLLTTFISAIIWLIIYALIRADILDFNAMSRQMMEEDSLK
jgi:predicted secreted protein